MNYTEKEVLQYVRENDVKFVKLAFCDLYGNMLNISILSGELPAAFRDGFAFAPRKVSGFSEITGEDLLLFPDPATLAVLPWRPQQGRVVRFFCDIRYYGGKRFEGDGRGILADAMKRAQKKGYLFKIGTSCEFYVTKTDSEGHPLREPYDRAGYCSAAPEDKGENLRRDVCLTLEQMEMQPVASRHESGPGQSEIDFRASNAMNAADNFITFRSVVKIVAARGGVYATFMPKPFAGECGSGMHINITVLKDGASVFDTKPDGKNGVVLSDDAKNMVAGVLEHAAEMTVFLNPVTNSYQRLGEDLAPRYISWSSGNYAQLVRVPVCAGEGHMILRSPDSACNPYIAFALIIHACMDGLEKKPTLCAPHEYDLENAPADSLRAMQPIPGSLAEAVKAARASAVLGQWMPERAVEAFCAIKEKTVADFKQAADKDAFEAAKYFYSL
ncbi:MAG: glutamine synthetase family protein [Oscillospiraceae bacterium]